MLFFQKSKQTNKKENFFSAETEKSQYFLKDNQSNKNSTKYKI